MSTLKICSWNVNGLRATIKTGDFPGFLANVAPDVAGFQEIKCNETQVDAAIWESLGYRAWWHCAEKPGYSGALLLSKVEPDDVRPGIGIAEYDSEGRMIEADFGDLTLITCYFPNGGQKGARMDFKLAFYDAFLARAMALRDVGRRVLFMGDLNVAHQVFDVARPAEAIKGTGFLPVERAWVDRVLEAGFVDTFRALHPDARDAYTYWEPWRERRARNIGWRIDYVFVDAATLPLVRRAFIESQVMGSDHCPVGVELELG